MISDLQILLGRHNNILLVGNEVKIPLNSNKMERFFSLDKSNRFGANMGSSKIGFPSTSHGLGRVCWVAQLTWKLTNSNSMSQWVSLCNPSTVEVVWNAFWIRFVFFYLKSDSGWNKQTPIAWVSGPHFIWLVFTARNMTNIYDFNDTNTVTKHCRNAVPKRCSNIVPKHRSAL